MGRVLLRSTGHNGAGIMAGVWKEREYGWINRAALLFNREETPAMLATVRGDGCSQAPAGSDLLSRQFFQLMLRPNPVGVELQRFRESLASLSGLMLFRQRHTHP